MPLSVVHPLCSTPKSILFVLGLETSFLAAGAIGRAARNTAKFRSILLEEHKEPMEAHHVWFACHSHLRHRTRPALLSAPSSLGFLLVPLTSN